MSLVNEDVGDDGGPPRPDPAAVGLAVAGELFEGRAPLRGAHEGLEFLLAFESGLRLAHRSTSGEGRGRLSADAESKRVRKSDQPRPAAGASLPVEGDQ